MNIFPAAIYFARRSLLDEVGGFEPAFGMKGRRIGYGEETVLIRRVRQQFPPSKLYYAADLYNYHLVRQEKMSFDWQLRHRFAQGRDSYHIFNDGAHRIFPAPHSRFPGLAVFDLS